MGVLVWYKAGFSYFWDSGLIFRGCACFLEITGLSFWLCFCFFIPGFGIWYFGFVCDCVFCVFSDWFAGWGGWVDLVNLVLVQFSRSRVGFWFGGFFGVVMFLPVRVDFDIC